MPDHASKNNNPDSAKPNASARTGSISAFQQLSADEQIQRALADPTRANLTPDIVSHLQRTLGNRAVSRLIAEAHRHEAAAEGSTNGDVDIGRKAPENVMQRKVYKKFRGNRKDYAANDAKTLASDIVKYVRQYKDSLPEYKNFDAIADQFTPEAVERDVIAGNYLTNEQDLNYTDLAKLLFQTMEQKPIREKTESSEAIVQGLKLFTVAATASVKPPNVVPPRVENLLDFHAPDIIINAHLGVEATNPIVPGQWKVGLTQTILSVRRYFEAITSDLHGTKRMKSTTLSTARANDRNSDSTAPWYSTTSVATIQDGFQVLKVELHDKPGEELSAQDTTFKLKHRMGGDAFKTWLILYNTATQQTVFLREWAWTVDYQNGAGIVTAVADANGRDVTGTTPPDAVLTGARGFDTLNTKLEKSDYDTPELQQFRSAASDLEEALEVDDDEEESQDTDEDEKNDEKSDNEKPDDLTTALIQLQNAVQEAYRNLSGDEQEEQKETRDSLVRQFWRYMDELDRVK